MIRTCTLLKLRDSNFTVWDIVLIPLLSATLTAGKMALVLIPNVEIVTLLFMVYASVFGFRKTFIVALIFSTTEIFFYGVQTWLLVYYFIWPLLIGISALLHRRTHSEWPYAITALIFGLAFGFVFAIFESFFYGISYGIVYWTRGIPFDLIHGGSNFVVVLFLFKPLYSLLTRLRDKYQPHMRPVRCEQSDRKLL